MLTNGAAGQVPSSSRPSSAPPSKGQSPPFDIRPPQANKSVHYPKLSEWLPELDGKDAADGRNVTCFLKAFTDEEYIRINELSTSHMTSEKLMALIPGLRTGTADYLLAAARRDRCAIEAGELPHRDWDEIVFDSLSTHR